VGGEVASIATGHLDKDYLADVAVASGGAIVVVHGRDRKLTHEPSISALVAGGVVGAVPRG
jgi:hypothetical protein